MPSTVRVVTVGVLIVMAAGCVLKGPSDVKRDLTVATGVEYDKEFGITLGRVGMSVARWAVKRSDDEDVARMLKGVRKLEVGVYHPAEGSGPGEGILRPSDFPDWNPLVEVVDETDRVLVLTRTVDGSIRRMLVVVDDSDELVIVRMRGKLDHVLEDAMRMAFEHGDRPELADPTIETYREESEVAG